MNNNQWYINEKYARKINGRCFIGGAIIGFGLALVSPIVRFVHHAMDKTIRDDIRKELAESKEEDNVDVF